MIGSIIDHGITKRLLVVSDDAGQFDVLLHALCWIHAESSINQIVPLNRKGKDDLQRVREPLWELYEDLTAHKTNPRSDEAERLSGICDEIFAAHTHSASLNSALEGAPHPCSNRVSPPS